MWSWILSASCHASNISKPVQFWFENIYFWWQMLKMEATKLSLKMLIWEINGSKYVTLSRHFSVPSWGVIEFGHIWVPAATMGQTGGYRFSKATGFTTTRRFRDWGKLRLLHSKRWPAQLGWAGRRGLGFMSFLLSFLLSFSFLLYGYDV